jgi:pimeloyl-ACP methyl ester carboxylesterase
MMAQTLPLLPQGKTEVKTVVEQRDADLARNASDGLPRLDNPPLVISGEQGSAVPQGGRADFGGHEIFTGPDSGHAVGLERTEELLAEVLSFLADQPRSRPLTEPCST